MLFARWRWALPESTTISRMAKAYRRPTTLADRRVRPAPPELSALSRAIPPRSADNFAGIRKLSALSRPIPPRSADNSAGVRKLSAPRRAIARRRADNSDGCRRGRSGRGDGEPLALVGRLLQLVHQREGEVG